MSQFSRNERRALKALLSEPSVTAAAKVAGLSPRTLYRYLARDDFRAELQRRQDAILAGTTAALTGLSGEAVATLRDLMQDPDAADGVKARAALGWLKEMYRASELVEITERLKKIEERVQNGT